MAIKTGVVNVAKLNVRKKADKESEVVTVITKGTEVTITSTRTGWHRVLLKGGIAGWCMAEFIKEE